jgi:S-adenosylmethionine:diacylglycerol 3-amino-3-carboxypropyl transferase
MVMATTPWRAGRFDDRAGPRQILFGQMYEDAAIEAAVFRPGGRVFCIASAGDTALRLAGDHEVTAVDINPVQLAYARRRIAGEPIEIGAAERVMALGRRVFCPLAGWRRATVEVFLRLEDLDSQVGFWNERLNTRRFRFGLDRLLSIAALKRIYASPFLGVLPRRLGEVMRARMERCFRTHPNRTNPYARSLLLGEAVPGDSEANAERIKLACADAATYLESCASGTFTGFTLSNILDGAPESYRRRLFDAVKSAGTKDSVVVLRSFREPASKTASDWAGRDRSMLWGSVEVRRAADHRPLETRADHERRRN